MLNEKGNSEGLRLGQSGAALILALLMISILVVLVLETLRAAQVEEVGSRHFQDSLQAEALAKSGLNLGVALLVQDLEENDVDHFGEPWSSTLQADELPNAFKAIGTLEARITDEAGKYPINKLVDDAGALRPAFKQVLERLLTNPPFKMEPEEVTKLIFAIKDWMDEDDEPTGEFGAETDYYKSLEKPYECKNGPLASLDEFQLIRGVSSSLYHGVGGGPALKDLLTIHSTGQININTAGPLVLQALVSGAASEDTAADWAETVIAYRRDPFHWDFLAESDWYRNRMHGYSDINLPTELITVRSVNFSVEMTGKVGAGRKSLFAYLERKKSSRDGEVQVNVSVKFWQFL
jgi:general secretion pathway protein K